MSNSVVIIGAGASGLTAAICAARLGAKVTILEEQDRPGKKLLVTGNGRCNLSNTFGNMEQSYYGTGKKIAISLIHEFGCEQTVDFFQSLGLLTQEKNGYLYPYTMQASSVLDVLLAETRRLQINLKCSQKILRITDCATEDGTSYEIETPTWTYSGDTLILACGSMAAPSTGATGDGYLLAQMCGHSIIPPCPALVPLTCDFSYLNRLSGVRCRARVTLFCDKEELATDTGELQWTNYGVSGIVVLSISRFVSVQRNSHRQFTLKLDFFPDYCEEELFSILSRRSGELLTEPISVLLRGFLHEKLNKVILETAGIRVTSCSELSEADLLSICNVLKNFSIPVSGTRSFDQAQVCAGGVDCNEVTSNLESRLHKGLYFSGEILDVDGPCGGYNLQWAFTSGYCAGSSAAGSPFVES